MLTTQSLRGIIVPVITPFDSQGHVDWLSYERLLERLFKSGIHGLLLNGVTGEASTIRDGELELLIRKARDVSQGKPVIAGVGYAKALATVRRLKLLKEMGADGALVPIVDRSQSRLEELIPYFEDLTVAELPIILHDLSVPRTSRAAIEDVLSIMDIHQVIGVKTSTGDIRRLFKFAHSSKKSVLCGEDSLFFASLSCGAKGGILASANLDSEPYLNIIKLFRTGKIPDAGRAFDQLTPLIQFLDTEPSPALLKWMLAQKGYIRSEKLRLEA
jgi:4-hydroxy-tetrahydrodipicolinate synthase